MKRIFPYFLLIAALSCGSSKPGNIDVTLSLDGAVDETTVQQIVFFIGDSSSTQKLLFPAECLSTTADGDSCLKSVGCGYDLSSSTFQPEINFIDLPDGISLEIFACALDASQDLIAQGIGTVPNTSGESVAITMDNDSFIECGNSISSLPDLCP